MNRIAVMLVGLALAVVVVAPTAQAQGLDPARTTDVGIAIGGTFLRSDGLGGAVVNGEPTGVDVVGGPNTGFTVVGSIGFRPIDSPVRFRLEAQYTRLGLDEEMRFGGGGAPEVADGHVSIISGTGNIVLAAPTARRLRPYLIGGLGIYRLSSEVGHSTPEGVPLDNSFTPSRSETKFGLNGGAGLRLAVGALHTFVEARYHGVFTESDKASFIPVTIGIRF
ncbi:MAG TPA: outer membrane beta-barrel protein [Gemmatimonadaceae bacterium]|nr:outer membrane beta-barrel protein [Gemmatimonadaceae bacterium]